jgi:pimeloyl-ACP methyl ester carboxylesterase
LGRLSLVQQTQPRRSQRVGRACTAPQLLEDDPHLRVRCRPTETQHLGSRLVALAKTDAPRELIEEPTHLASVGQLCLEQVLNHYRSMLKGKPIKPILVGHSMGGLIAQKLLQ